MNPFEPARLSPIPRTPLACALPYDLAWDDLRAILPGFAERGAIQAQAFVSYEKQGLNGGPNSCILTLRYPTVGNQLRSETVFIKRTADPRKREAGKYRYLAAQGIPTPRLLADIPKGGAEIILLEFLRTIGIDFHSSGEVDDLLHLLARLNSIPIPPDFFHPSPGVPQEEFDERVRSVLTEMSSDRALPFPIDVPRWFEAYQVAQKACESLPPAVNHNEFSFQQVGWAQRGDAPQLVLFDLETLSFAPRFTDLAGILNPLAAYTGRDRRELFQIYYDKFCELGRLEPGIDQAFHELRLVNILGTFWSLPWYADARDSGISELIGTTPAMAATGLYHDLTALELI